MNSIKYLSNLSPIIIVGMHRSGTTLVTKFLRRNGGFFGWNRDHNEEAMFFLNRNAAILKSDNILWSDVPSINKINIHEIIKKNIDLLTDDLLSLPILEYFGPKHFLNYHFNKEFPPIWGWKDPRNVLLLPLWLSIFPNAKIIHVFRNGVDVAQSLIVRERLRREKKHRQKNKSTLISGNPFSRKKARKFLSKHIIDSAGYCIVRNKYSQNPRSYISNIELLGDAFKVWIHYLDLVANLENLMEKVEVIDIRYEDFLTSPDYLGRDLLRFVGLKYNSERVKAFTSMINSNRAHAFFNKSELVQFYRKIKNNKYMVKYGYNNIEYYSE